MIDFYEVLGRMLCDKTALGHFNEALGLPPGFDLIGEPSSPVVSFTGELYARVREYVEAKKYLSLSPFLSLFGAGELLYGLGDPEWRKRLVTLSQIVQLWNDELGPAYSRDGLFYVGLSILVVDGTVRDLFTQAPGNLSLRGAIADKYVSAYQGICGNANFADAANAVCGKDSGWRPPCFVKHLYYSGHVHPQG